MGLTESPKERLRLSDFLETLCFVVLLSFSWQAETVTSESEGEVEVASPAGQEGGKLSDDQLNWLMTNIICWQHIYIFIFTIFRRRGRGSGLGI